jgi:hypothetical protein
LATGKTPQRKWWWIWSLIQTGSAGKIVEICFAAKNDLLMFGGCPYRYGHENGEYC